MIDIIGEFVYGMFVQFYLDSLDFKQEYDEIKKVAQCRCQ